MTTSSQNATPAGLYALSVLMIALAFKTVYSAANNDINIYFAAISATLFIFVGIGIISRWPKAKDVYMVVAVLLFLGAIPDVLLGLFSEKAAVQNAIHVAEIIFQLTIFPVAYFYFKKEEVTSYFEPTS